MSVTILGYHIRLIRSAKINLPIITKKDLPRAKYDKRPKTIKLNDKQRRRIGLVFSWSRPSLFNF